MNYFCDLENREAREIVPGVRIRTFWANQMLLSMVELDAHAGVPTHNHPHEQAGVIISGRLQMTIDGEARWLEPGDSYIIPGGVDHMAVAGDEPARALDVFSPVRAEYQY
jgi:quercetin dioxygenase-like cupin family protein